MDLIAERIRDVPDFPQKGMLFKDLTPLLADAEAFAAAIDALAEPWRGRAIDQVCGIEARGFILGAVLARELGAGFVPLRKPGKLPGALLSENYALDVAEESLHMHVDALAPEARVVLIDDVLATGGTLAAARRLIERSGAELLGASVLVEIAMLAGRTHWDAKVPLHAVLTV